MMRSENNELQNDEHEKWGRDENSFLMLLLIECVVLGTGRSVSPRCGLQSTRAALAWPV